MLTPEYANTGMALRWSDTQEGRHLRRRYGGIAVFLILMLPLTLGLRIWREAHVLRHGEQQQAEAVADAFDLIERQFAAIQAELWSTVADLAGSDAVVSGLSELGRGMGDVAREDLVEHAANLDLPDRTAIEIYDADLQLQAWNGFTLPTGHALERPGFMEARQMDVAPDGDQRLGFTVWWPVRDGGRFLGMVRGMRLVRVRTPVQNQFLRSYSLAETWERATDLQVVVQWEGGPAEAPLPNARMRPLHGIDGTLLARVYVQPPTIEQLLGEVRARFNDVLVFWTTLLLFWLVAGLWLWYSRPGSRPTQVSDITEQRAWLAAFCRFAVFATAWWGLRFSLLALHVPARWQEDRAPLAPLFDPTHLASAFGGGLFRSTGDLLITAIFALVFAVTWLELAARFRDRYRGRAFLAGEDPGTDRIRRGTAVCLALISAAILLAIGVVVLLGVITRHAILDSTLDYFVRSGLIPDPPERLLLVIFCGLLILTVAVITIVVGIMWGTITLLVRHHPKGWSPRTIAGYFLVLVIGISVPLHLLTGMGRIVPFPVVIVFVMLGAWLAVFGRIRRDQGMELLSLRGISLSIFVVSVLLYPICFQGMDARLRMQMTDAAETFSERRDPRVIFALEQLLEEVQSSGRGAQIEQLLTSRGDSVTKRLELDSLAASAMSGSFLSSLGLYDVSLTVLDRAGRPVGRYYEAQQAPGPASLDAFDTEEFDILQQMYRESGSSGVMVEQITGRLQRDRFQYVGIVPLENERGIIQGWVMARAESQTLFQYKETPFPRVLLPSGASRSLQDELALSEFRNGVLVRSLGQDYGRYALSTEVRRALVTHSEFWQQERGDGRLFLTYYRREEPDRSTVFSDVLPQATGSILAVRVPAVNTFDHLYYLLRLTVAGLLLGLPLYAVGAYGRWRIGLLPAARVRFKDKVLNAFLGVGLVTVLAIGIVGQEVVEEETVGAEREGLRRHLEQIEQILALRAQTGELPYRVLARTDIDSLSAVIGADVNVYKGPSLVATTRPQLVRDRLISDRMPIGAYEAVFLKGQRTAFVQENIGSFVYRAGYHALLDERGEPHFVVSIPTLPEQERIEEERTRTTAYLFGALLLLLLVVMSTAAIVADALARPVGRLRVGLEAVAKGQFEQKIPVVTRDEVGDLVRTFNEMQEQLAESRRELAQHERQLAWREMARQVAHEIKNPLTPMKLSVQHLRRAFYDMARKGTDGMDEQQFRRFAGLFDRITNTLIEQIDALARIANEFHSFARMPTRVMERLDLNSVVQEAVSLMQEEEGAEIELRLHKEPLIVEADREELRRIYINLLKNAFQSIPEDREGHVEVETAPDGFSDGLHWAVCAVRDNGSGIPADLRDKIFQPNFSTKTSGTGLGLAIARKGVEEMKGEIGFETEEGQGTTFQVKLPLVEEVKANGRERG